VRWVLVEVCSQWQQEAWRLKGRVATVWMTGNFIKNENRLSEWGLSVEASVIARCPQWDSNIWKWMSVEASLFRWFGQVRYLGSHFRKAGPLTRI
jgi:hypothetical protein